MSGPSYFKKNPEIMCRIRNRSLYIPPNRPEGRIPLCKASSFVPSAETSQTERDGKWKIRCEAKPQLKTKIHPSLVGHGHQHLHSDMELELSLRFGEETPGSNDMLAQQFIESKTVSNPDTFVCPTYITGDGISVTNMTGWEDYNNSFMSISLMSRRDNPDIRKRRPRHAIKRNAMYFVRLENIVDPLNFYMEFLTNPPKDGCVNWNESFQKFYNQSEVMEKYKLRTLKPYVGQMYAVYTEETRQWERIRVHHLRVGFTVSGMYLDRLQAFSGISFESLYELHPKYGNWPRYPINGGLTDIRPCGYVPTEYVHKSHHEWSLEATEYFRNYVKDKLFRAFVVDKALVRTDNIPHGSDEDRFTQLSVYLFEAGAEQIPVNTWMVFHGYAIPIRSMETCLELVEILHGLKLEGKKSTTKENNVEKDQNQ